MISTAFALVATYLVGINGMVAPFDYQVQAGMTQADCINRAYSNILHGLPPTVVGQRCVERE